MISKFHPLLKRQVDKCFGKDFAIPENMHGFLLKVSEAYEALESEHQLLNRAMELSSKEMVETNKLLRSRNERINISQVIGTILSQDLEAATLLKECVNSIASSKVHSAVFLSTVPNTLETVPQLHFASLAESAEVERELLLSTIQTLSPGWKENFETFRESENYFLFSDWLVFPLIDDQCWGFLGIRGVREVAASEGHLEWLRSLTDTLVKWHQTTLARKMIQDQQAQIISSRKMSLLGQMAGGIAHEINNPLAIILCLLGEIREEVSLSSINLEEILKLLEKADNTTKRIAKIISGLRTFSRDGSNDPYETTTLGKVLEDTLSFCTAKFQKNQVGLVVTADPTAALQCRATQISQVLLNLLSNAFDALHGVPGARVEIGSEDHGDSLSIFVTDNGKVIDSELKDKIFQPFFSTKPVGKGTGLGLSISAGIAKSHRGSLELETDAQSNCFRLKIPKIQDLRSTAQPPIHQPCRVR